MNAFKIRNTHNMRSEKDADSNAVSGDITSANKLKSVAQSNKDINELMK